MHSPPGRQPREISVLALVEDGGLFARPTDLCNGASPGWEQVANVGAHIQSVAVHGDRIFGVNENAAVDSQAVGGACAPYWSRHTRGRVVDLAIHDGTLYGSGVGRNGGPVYRWAGYAQGWQQVSNGRAYAIAADDTMLYCIGNDGWAYQQLFTELSPTSKWRRAFDAQGITSFAVLGGGRVLGVREGQVVALDLYGGKGQNAWCVEPMANFPCAVRALTLACDADFRADGCVCRMDAVDSDSNSNLQQILLHNSLGMTFDIPAPVPTYYDSQEPWRHQQKSSDAGARLPVAAHAPTNESTGAGSSGREQSPSGRLRRAADNGDMGLAREMLQDGASVHATDKGGKTPLHYAARAGASEVAALLLRSGADANARDHYGARPCDEAEYWSIKQPRGDTGQLREACLATLGILHSYGGTRCDPAERTDQAGYFAQLQKLEEIAAVRGVVAPWQEAPGTPPPQASGAGDAAFVPPMQQDLPPPRTSAQVTPSLATVTFQEAAQGASVTAGPVKSAGWV
mmetsp:Transcript_74408/g.206605  ORF Transcript_74408/g.206605 Transcript_74408/m.206605 type:complete len:515 (+) Transcript_74408:80-1624(+)